MYKEVYVPVDNSDYSNQACVIGVDVARHFGGRVAGCHAYAAKMHDVRFRQMESGLQTKTHRIPKRISKSLISDVEL